MSSRLEIVTYRPKPGLVAMLSTLLRRHQDLLHRRGLVHAGHDSCIVLDEGTAIEIMDYKDDDSRKLAAVDHDILKVRRDIEAHVETVSRVDLG